VAIPSGVNGTALDAMMDVAGSLTIVEIMVAAIIVQPNRNEKQQSGNQKANDK
jgi:hypothetical protein